MSTAKCEYCARRGATSWCSACKRSVYCSKTCQRKHWKQHKPTCQIRNDVRALAIAPLFSAPMRPLPPGQTTVDPLWLVSLQIFQHFGRERANDYLVYESSVKLLLRNPIEIYGWTRFHIRTVCREEEFKLLNSSNSNVVVLPSDRQYACYVVRPTDSDDEDEEGEDNDLIDLGRYNHSDRREIGSGRDEFTYRHPGTVPEGDEQIPHLGLVDPEMFSPTTTKASKQIRVITFVSRSIYGRILTSYNNQFAIRIDNRRRCLDLDCYEFKPDSCGRHRSEDPEHLPNPEQIHQFDSIISCEVPTGIRASPSPQETRTICHMKALAGKFFKSRCYRFRIALDHVSGIRLVKGYDKSITAQQKANKDIAAALANPLHSKGKEDAEIVQNNDREREDLDTIASALIMEVSRPPLPNAFCVRAVAEADNSFRIIGDWTPERAASRATRIIVYGSFGELRELAAHLCVIDPRITNMFQNGGGSLEGKSLLFDHAPSPAEGIEFPPISEEDKPNQDSFDGNLPNLMDCVKDRLVAMAEAGNHLGAAYVAKSLGLTKQSASN